MNELSKTECRHRSRPWRVLLVGVGLLCVGLAVLGALLPGLPTTVFLLIASYCFARSCPGLEERLLKRNRLFRPYLSFIESGRPLPLHAKVGTIVMMWAFIAASALAFHGRGTVGTAFAIGIVAAGIAGTVAVLRFRRRAEVTTGVESRSRTQTA